MKLNCILCGCFAIPRASGEVESEFLQDLPEEVVLAGNGSKQDLLPVTDGVVTDFDCARKDPANSMACQATARSRVDAGVDYHYGLPSVRAPLSSRALVGGVEYNSFFVNPLAEGSHDGGEPIAFAGAALCAAGLGLGHNNPLAAEYADSCPSTSSSAPHSPAQVKIRALMPAVAGMGGEKSRFVCACPASPGTPLQAAKVRVIGITCESACSDRSSSLQHLPLHPEQNLDSSSFGIPPLAMRRSPGPSAGGASEQDAEPCGCGQVEVLAREHGLQEQQQQDGGEELRRQRSAGGHCSAAGCARSAGSLPETSSSPVIGRCGVHGGRVSCSGATSCGGDRGGRRLTTCSDCAVGTADVDADALSAGRSTAPGDVCDVGVRVPSTPGLEMEQLASWPPATPADTAPMKRYGSHSDTLLSAQHNSGIDEADGPNNDASAATGTAHQPEDRPLAEAVAAAADAVAFAPCTPPLAARDGAASAVAATPGGGGGGRESRVQSQLGDRDGERGYARSDGGAAEQLDPPPELHSTVSAPAPSPLPPLAVLTQARGVELQQQQDPLLKTQSVPIGAHLVTHDPESDRGEAEEESQQGAAYAGEGLSADSRAQPLEPLAEVEEEPLRTPFGAGSPAGDVPLPPLPLAMSPSPLTETETAQERVEAAESGSPAETGEFELLAPASEASAEGVVEPVGAEEPAQEVQTLPLEVEPRAMSGGQSELEKRVQVESVAAGPPQAPSLAELAGQLQVVAFLDDDSLALAHSGEVPLETQATARVAFPASFEPKPKPKLDELKQQMTEEDAAATSPGRSSQPDGTVEMQPPADGGKCPSTPSPTTAPAAAVCACEPVTPACSAWPAANSPVCGALPPLPTPDSSVSEPNRKSSNSGIGSSNSNGSGGGSDGSDGSAETVAPACPITPEVAEPPRRAVRRDPGCSISGLAMTRLLIRQLGLIQESQLICEEEEPEAAPLPQLIAATAAADPLAPVQARVSDPVESDVPLCSPFAGAVGAAEAALKHVAPATATAGAPAMQGILACDSPKGNGYDRDCTERPGPDGPGGVPASVVLDESRKLAEAAAATADAADGDDVDNRGIAYDYDDLSSSLSTTRESSALFDERSSYGRYGTGMLSARSMQGWLEPQGWKPLRERYGFDEEAHDGGEGESLAATPRTPRMHS